MKMPKMPEDPRDFGDFLVQLDVYRQRNLRSWRNSLVFETVTVALNLGVLAWAIASIGQVPWYISVLWLVCPVGAVTLVGWRWPRSVKNFLEADSTFWAGEVPWPMAPRDLFIRDVRWGRTDDGKIVVGDDDA